MRHALMVLGLVALLGAGPVHADSERRLVLVSDLHVGAGRLPGSGPAAAWSPLEDFRWQADFDAFLDAIAAADGPPVDLVLLGDVFELWQSPTAQCSSDVARPGCRVPDCVDGDKDQGCTEAEALARLRAILAAHPAFIASLQRLAAGGRHQVHLVPGNHDAALLFPALRAELHTRFGPAGLTVHDKGHWLSADGRIYADHGHQFDFVNRFLNWPHPWARRAPGQPERLERTWGENMVQRFYNQYEWLFPIVDNLATESEGVAYAVKQAGFAPAVEAVGRFADYLLFGQSFGQAADFLGGAGAKWDRDQVRAKPPRFFVQRLQRDATLHRLATEALEQGRLEIDARRLSDGQVDQLCADLAHLAQDGLRVERCPQRDGALGAAVAGALGLADHFKASHLRHAMAALGADAARRIGVYVYGHTHRAEPVASLSLGEGLPTLRTVNTGAFQRVVSSAQLDALVGLARRPAQALVPDDLPACYTFVRIEPYRGEPRIEPMRWRLGSGGFVAEAGSCLSLPPAGASPTAPTAPR